MIYADNLEGVGRHKHDGARRKEEWTLVEASAVLEHFTYFGIFSLLILGGFGLPFPEEGVLILSGLLIAHGVIKLVPAVVVIYPSLLIADLTLYSIGRKYGRMIVDHKKFSKMISSATLSRFEQGFARWGALMVFAGRSIVGFRAPMFLISGTVRIPRAKFLAADGLSAMVTTSLTLALGYYGGHSLMILRKDITRMDHALIVVLLASVATWIIVRYFRGRTKGKEGM